MRNGSTLPGLETVQMAAQGWAMDSQGRFDFSMVTQPGPSIVRISADGTACDYVTSAVDVPSNSRENVGGGYDDFQFDFRAFEIREPDGRLTPRRRRQPTTWGPLAGLSHFRRLCHTRGSW